MSCPSLNALVILHRWLIMEVVAGVYRLAGQVFEAWKKKSLSFLWQKLYKTGREMQERIMDLLVVVENEDVTVELIQVNEDLNNAILGCERWAGVCPPQPFSSAVVPGGLSVPRVLLVDTQKEQEQVPDQPRLLPRRENPVPASLWYRPAGTGVCLSSVRAA